MGTKRNGLLALLGIGALAFWKYKKMTPEEQKDVQDKITRAKDNLMSATEDIRATVEDKLNEAKGTVEDRYSEVKSKAGEKLQEAKKELDKAKDDVKNSPSFK